MRKLISRVEDVFQIADRGCVVHPGIPRSSDVRLKIGDTLWLKRPEGSEFSTLVRGIELGGSISSPGIPILLGAEVSKDQIPYGTTLSIDFTPVGKLAIHARCTSGPVDLSRVFFQGGDGRLGFGWSARSACPATMVDVQDRPIEFLDHVMEGFTSYHLQVAVNDAQIILTLGLHGTSRDRYLDVHVKFHLEQAGFVIDA